MNIASKKYENRERVVPLSGIIHTNDTITKFPGTRFENAKNTRDASLLRRNLRASLNVRIEIRMDFALLVHIHQI